MHILHSFSRVIWTHSLSVQEALFFQLGWCHGFRKRGRRNIPVCKLMVQQEQHFFFDVAGYERFELYAGAVIGLIVPIGATSVVIYGDWFGLLARAAMNLLVPISDIVDATYIVPDKASTGLESMPT
jgi:hypothetical protein